MREAFGEVLSLQSEYTPSNSPAMQRRGVLIRHEIANELRGLLPALTEASGIADLRVEGRDATGLKTEVPWTRVYSASKSPSATEGWYLVYLFSAGGDRVYLSLNQGTQSWDGREYRARPRQQLVDRVDWARAKLAASQDYPGTWSTGIVLDARRALGRGYETGNVIGAEYTADALPSDEQIEEDILRAAVWLSTIYERSEDSLDIPGERAPEVVDAEMAIAINAGRSSRRGQGLRLSTPEKKAVEQRAVDVVTEHLRALGFTVKDVGLKESYDLDARSPEQHLKVEVKGTTSAGQEILLTANEVALHVESYPDNALGIVHSVKLNRLVDPPIASGGTLVFESPWSIVETNLVAMSYRYPTGL